MKITTVDGDTVLDAILTSIAAAKKISQKMPPEIKRRVVEYIKGSNITQKRFAQVSGLTTTTLCAWVRLYDDAPVVKTLPKEEWPVENEPIKEPTKPVEVRIVHEGVDIFVTIENLKTVVESLK